jgi:hypothetical protein
MKNIDIVQNIFVMDLSNKKELKEYIENDKFLRELLKNDSLFGEFYNSDRQNIKDLLCIDCQNIIYRIRNLYVISDNLYMDIEYIEGGRQSIIFRECYQDINIKKFIKFIPRLLMDSITNKYTLVTIDAGICCSPFMNI